MQHTQNLHFPEMDKPWRTSFCLILNPQGCKKLITTGYIDRKVYEVNPLTLQDFRDYLESKKMVLVKFGIKVLKN